jgi:hypothetical protein
VLTYKYGASDPHHHHLRANPLIFLESLRRAAEAGCTRLDLGRTELDNPGLRDFKRHFGAEELELQYTLLGGQAIAGGVRSVSRLQRSAIRRSPPIVGRLVGAALYRHFG